MKSECVCNPHFYPSHTFSLKLGPSCEVLMVMFSLVQSVQFSPVQSSSVQSCPVHCDTMDCSTPGFPVHHQLPELSQTHVHWVADVIQSSHPLSSPSPAFSLLQQSLFQQVSSSHEVAKVLEFQLQHQSFQWTFRTDFPQDWLVWFPCSPRDSQESSRRPQFQKHQFFALSLLHSQTLTPIHDHWKNHSFDYMDSSQQSNVYAF